jgi:hypothetical protein
MNEQDAANSMMGLEALFDGQPCAVRNPSARKIPLALPSLEKRAYCSACGKAFNPGLPAATKISLVWDAALLSLLPMPSRKLPLRAR